VKIKRIHIENYRSIKEADFNCSDYCVLIGENNSGKSNILRAINLALGELWPSERMFSEEDFYNQDTSNDLVIQVYFDSPITQWQNAFKADVYGVELRCKTYKKRVKKKPAGSFKVDYTCVDDKGKTINIPSSPLKTGEKFTGSWLPMRVTSLIREEGVSVIYVDVLRSYNQQSPSSRWSVLRKLFNEVNTQFINDKTEVTIEEHGEKKKLTRKQAFENSIKNAYKYLRTDSFTEIEELLAKNAMDQMGLDEGENKIELQFETHDPTNAFKSLQLYVNQLGIQSPASEVGAGLQSAIVVAIFRTYEELKKEGSMFAIEEPEVFLHPQKARYFGGILRGLSDKGNQIFLTTHSPVFVHIDQPESVLLVKRNITDGTKVFQAEKVEMADDDRKALRLLSEFDSQRNEMFFARKVLFVEGNTEKLSMPILFQKMGIDINKENVSVIECGGKTKIPLFAKVAEALGIEYAVLFDEDIKDADSLLDQKKQDEIQEKNKKHKQWNEAITKITSKEKTFILKPNFEKELGLSGDDKQKIDQAVEYFQNVDLTKLPDIFKNTVNYFVTKKSGDMVKS